MGLVEQFLLLEELGGELGAWVGCWHGCGLLGLASLPAEGACAVGALTRPAWLCQAKHMASCLSALRLLLSCLLYAVIRLRRLSLNTYQRRDPVRSARHEFVV